MNLYLKSRQLINFIKGIVFLNIFFLVGTFIFNNYYFNILNSTWQDGSQIKYILLEFCLARENVLATWYSSMVFFSVGIIFFICYLIKQKDLSKKYNNILSFGWLVFSGIFVLLSLDEMASLHERLGNITDINPLPDLASGWVALLGIPIALVAGFMIWFCLLQVKRAPVAAFFTIAGVLVFLSIPVQEYYEMHSWQTANNSESWKRPVGFLLLEEGSELFGATLMMVSGLLFAYNLSTDKKFTLGSSFVLKFQLDKRNILFQYAAGSVVLFLLMVTIVNNDLLNIEGEISDLGKRENWFPAVSAFLCSLLCLYLYFKDSFFNSPKIFLYLSAFSLLISAFYGSDLYNYMYSPFSSNYKIFIFAFLSFITLGLAIKMFISMKDRYDRTAILLWAFLLILAFGIGTWFAAALVFMGFAFLSLLLIYRITTVPVVSGSRVVGSH